MDSAYHRSLKLGGGRRRKEKKEKKLNEKRGRYWRQKKGWESPGLSFLSLVQWGVCVAYIYIKFIKRGLVVGGWCRQSKKGRSHYKSHKVST